MSIEHARPTGDEDRLLADDLLKGGPAIAAYGGWSLRQAYHLIATGAIPTSRAGRRVYARKSELRARFASSNGGGGAM